MCVCHPRSRYVMTQTREREETHRDRIYVNNKLPREYKKIRKATRIDLQNKIVFIFNYFSTFRFIAFQYCF